MREFIMFERTGYLEAMRSFNLQDWALVAIITIVLFLGVTHKFLIQLYRDWRSPKYYQELTLVLGGRSFRCLPLRNKGEELTVQEGLRRLERFTVGWTEADREWAVEHRAEIPTIIASGELIFPEPNMGWKSYVDILLRMDKGWFTRSVRTSREMYSSYPRWLIVREDQINEGVDR